jgi:argininosuccinate synthase
MSKKVVLAYSGGLDTSAIVPWLIENKGCEVHAFVADVGQGEDELAGVEAKAIASGAVSCKIADLTDEFVDDYVMPTIQTGAIYEGKYLLGTAIARPIIAKAQAEHALAIGADAVSHGCTGKGNDQVRFESAFAAIAPNLEVMAPWREWDLTSREALLAYLAERQIPCTASATKIYSRDRNIWHISHEGGAIEDPWNAAPEDAWQMTSSIENAPNAPEDVSITFEQGMPVALEGRAMSATEILEALNLVGGEHGVGRVDLVENRLVGMKSRGLYETPGGTILVAAYHALEELVHDRMSLHYKEHVGLTFAELVYNGQWFTPLREALTAFASNMAQKVTGTVVVKLHKAHAIASQRQSPNSLYDEQFATFGKDEVYNQTDAAGFIKLWSLPQRISALHTMGAVTS